jgi:nicotinamide-nucleotide amidase
MRVEVICTGDEVLTGKIVNSNFSLISQRLEDVGLQVLWGTTVGDDREQLLDAFQRAGRRADAVVVNGGLGPTVDDLSQEIAAKAAGVDLALDEGWLARMTEFFERRQRAMPPSNRKQAMLPRGAEVLDNPIGTACGFAVDIGRARFFFTPGVPRELKRMLEEQVIPRLLARSGAPGIIRLKRFHSYGIGEARADTLLDGIEAMAEGGCAKLGFRAHYPQLETKLVVRGRDESDIARKLAPLEAEIRRRLGGFVVAEDDATLEGVVVAGLAQAGASLALAETFSAGQMAARIAHLPGADAVFCRAVVARTPSRLGAALGLDLADFGPAAAARSAEAVRAQARATIGLAMLVDLDEGADRVEFGGTLRIAIASPAGLVAREARIVGGREWVRLGAIEMGLDCLRRFLAGLPIAERTDFERR